MALSETNRSVMPQRSSAATSSDAPPPETLESPDCPQRLGRPRCPKATKAIVRATLSLLRRSGFAGLTIDAVAERAGVGKATIYRWWPNKAALVVDAFFSHVSPRLPFADTGSVRGDFRSQMQLVVDEMCGPNGRLLAQLVSATQTDAELRRAFRERWLRPRRAEGLPAIARAIARGELPRNVDIEFLFDSLYGPLYLRLLFEHAPLTPAFVERLVAITFDGLEQATRHRKRGH